MKVAIKHPIIVNGVVEAPAGTELSVRRPKAKDMVIIGDHIPALASLDNESEEAAVKSMSGAVIKGMIAVVGALTDIGEEAAAEMDFNDLLEVSKAAMSLLGEAQRGGEGETGEQQSRTPLTSSTPR